MTVPDGPDRYHNADIGYEAEVVAKLTGLSRQQAFRLIEKHGRDRENLMREAEQLKDASSHPALPWPGGSEKSDRQHV
jgi:hypothetical protein